MRMRFEVRFINRLVDGRLLVQLAGEFGNNIQLFMPLVEETRLRVGQELILADIDEEPSSFSSTDFPPGRRRFRLK